MFRLAGITLAFCLGYLTASYGLFSFLWEEKRCLYVLAAMLLGFMMILIPMERIAEAEARRSSGYPFRTSAREHLQRRGSF